MMDLAFEQAESLLKFVYTNTGRQVIVKKISFDMDIVKELIGIEDAIANVANSEIGKYFRNDKKDEISKNLKKLISFSKEHKSKAFLMMVIGPTKSGKSTLVNLLARDIVSPTDVAECTIRPSIIARKNDSIKDDIIVYKSKGDDKDLKVECLDAVVNILKNTADEDEKNLVDDKETHVISELEKVITNQIFTNDRTVITAVTTEASEGILSNTTDDNHIYIVDMPGFDGAKVNSEFDDEYLYKAMTERVDLILFVQSSVLAILDSSTKYFKYLKESCSKNVPVFLINNAYDSKSWRKEKNTEDIIKQENEALEAIRKNGIMIYDRTRNVKSINLGMAYDYYFKDKEKIAIVGPENILKDEYSKFTDFERTLKEDITNHINDIRLGNCKKKVTNAMESLLFAINNEIETLDKKKDEKDKLKIHLEERKTQLVKDIHNHLSKHDGKDTEVYITEQAENTLKAYRAELDKDIDMEADKINETYQNAISSYVKKLTEKLEEDVATAEYEKLHTLISNIDVIDKNKLGFNNIKKYKEITLNNEEQLVEKKGIDWKLWIFPRFKMGTKYKMKERVEIFDTETAKIVNKSREIVKEAIVKMEKEFEQNIIECFESQLALIVTEEEENEIKNLKDLRAKLETVRIK